MSRFNFKPFQEFWSIAKLYWLGEEKKGAFTLLALLGVVLLGYTQLSVLLNAQQGNFVTFLAKKDPEKFWESVKIFLIILVIYVPLFAAFSYIQNKLGLFWRRWLTNHYLNKYFNNRSFYNLVNSRAEIDNPDQRISEDINSFTISSLSLFLVIVSSVLQVIAFSAQLWSISQVLVYFLFFYAIVGSLITIFVYGKTLVRLNFEQLKKEANFRFGLVRIRENAESIAFYRGEKQEISHLKKLFTDLYNNFSNLILWQELFLGLFSNVYEFLPILIPTIILAPSILSGNLEVGKLTEAIGAFMRVFYSLNIIVSRFQFLTSFVAGIDRLYTFAEYIDTPEVVNGRLNHPTIDTIEPSETLAIQNLTLETPNYQRTLIENVSVELQSGQGLLIMGASGCGKSSILRAIAGLWNSGTGAIKRPKLEDILFLPQRPYMILGSLRDQLIYPSTETTLTEEDFQKILVQVNLADLAERFGGFNTEKEWESLLSLGEQQRLAFARILVNKPAYVILDEATSALDIKNEESLYQHLEHTETTYISVGHRPTLMKYHDWVLNILEEQKWELKKAVS